MLTVGGGWQATTQGGAARAYARTRVRARVNTVPRVDPYSDL
jgi:hypothetical protein